LTPPSKGATSSTEVDVEGRRLKLSNIDKLLYPASGFTKGHVIDYYRRVAPALLTHLRQRPLTLKRYPNGVEGQFFYEKNCPSHRPEWLPTVTVASVDGKSQVRYCLVDDLPSLVWVANLASLELHTSLSSAADVSTPTMVVFDLDPGPPAGVVECARVALLLRDLLEPMGLMTFPKTSGSKGLQIYLPLNTPAAYGDTKPFAHAVARLLETRYPSQILSVMKKELRTGKVFIDWSQNDAAKTTVCVYSLRARPRPAVSTPVTWDEVEAAADSGDPALLDFDADAVLSRLDSVGDCFAPVAELEQSLPALPAG